MPQKYRVTLSDGRTFDVTTDGAAPSEADVLASLSSQPDVETQGTVAPAAPPSGLGQMKSAFETAKDLGAGFAKAAGRSVKFIADDLPHAAGGAGLSDYIDLATGRPKGTSYQMVDTGLQSKNAAQTVGGLAETGAELALPMVAGARAIPTTAKAGALFNEVSAQAGKVPVETKAINEAIMRVKDEVDAGAGSMPQVVTKLINRLDQPIQNAGPFVYDESRKFASNLGALTVRDIQSLNRAGQAAVANLAATVARANADAALVVGKGAEYAKAMNMYASAKRLETLVKKGIPIALGSAAGAVGLKYAYDKAKSVLGGE